MDRQVPLFATVLLIIVSFILGYLFPRSTTETKSVHAHGTELQLGVTKDAQSITHQLEDVEDTKVIITKPDGSVKQIIKHKVIANNDSYRIFASRSGEKMKIIDISDQESEEVQKPRYSLGIIVYSAIVPFKIGGTKLKPFYGINVEMRIFGDIWAGIHYLPKLQAIGIGMKVQF